MKSLPEAYVKYSDLYVRNIKFLSSYDSLLDNNMFSQMMIERAKVYNISLSDILIFSLFCFMNPPYTLENYVKLPKNNKIILKNVLNNVQLIAKKVAESFNLTLAQNKNMNKKIKNSFNYEQLHSLPNKCFMGIDLIRYFREEKFFNLKKELNEALDKEDIVGISLAYLLTHLVFEEEDQKEALKSIEQRGDLLIEKVKFKIENYFDVSIDMLKIHSDKCHDLFVDEQLIKITEYAKKEKESIINSFSNDERKYVDLINTLTEKINQLEKEKRELEKESFKRTLPLSNKNILVVGDTGRKDSYKEIIERYGGNFNFIDGIFETEKINLLCEKTDLAVLITTRMKHKISNVVKSNGVPSIFVNSAGIQSFEDVISSYCS